MILFCIKILYVFINVLIGVYDFSFYRIPNILLGALLVLYAFYASLYLGGDHILSSLAVGAGMLALGFACFAFKFIGAGDAKYLVVISLWMGLPGVLNFILIFSLTGGGLGLIYLMLPHHMARLSDWIWSHIQKAEERYPCFEYIWAGSGVGAEKNKRANIGVRSIPYGIAIAVGAIITMLYTITL